MIKKIGNEIHGPRWREKLNTKKSLPFLSLLFIVKLFIIRSTFYITHTSKLVTFFFILLHFYPYDDDPYHIFN